MKEALEQLLVKLMYEEAILLVPGTMTDKQRDWVVRGLATIQSDKQSSTDEPMDNLSDEELLEIINGNTYGSGNESAVETRQSKLLDEAEAERTQVVPIRTSK